MVGGGGGYDRVNGDKVGSDILRLSHISCVSCGIIGDNDRIGIGINDRGGGLVQRVGQYILLRLKIKGGV